jgi:hypothetical protein
MIDLEAVNSILQATQSLAKAQQNANQVNQTQAAPPASAAPADTDPATSQLFAQPAAKQPPQTVPTLKCLNGPLCCPLRSKP